MSQESERIPNKLERVTLERALQILQKYSELGTSAPLDHYLWKVARQIEKQRESA